jgi:hypothetical protein
MRIAFTCQIDTGSSDLWVISQDNQKVATVNTTDVVATIFYGDGSGVTGNVDFAELTFGGHTVKSQGAFIQPLTNHASRFIHVYSFISVY